MSIPTGEPAGLIGGQSRVRPRAEVLRSPRADAPRRRPGDRANHRDRVRSEPDQAVLERGRSRARPPPTVEQEHGHACVCRARGPLEQRGDGQCATVPAQRNAGRKHQGAESPAVLLLRVQPPDRLAEAVGGRRDRRGVAGTGQADPVAFEYVVRGQKYTV